MRLSLKTKFTLTTALLVLGVVALISGLYVAALTRQVIQHADELARFVTLQVFFQAQHALRDAKNQERAPASESPQDLREYVRQSLDEDAALTSLVEAVLGYSPLIYEVTVVGPEGKALISSDASLPGRAPLEAAPLAQLVQLGFLGQLRALYGPPQIYEFTFPLSLRFSEAGGENQAVPYGHLRVVLSGALLKRQIAPAVESAAWLGLGALLVSVVLAGAVSHAALAPLTKISAQLDHIARGEFDLEPVRGSDELAQVSSQITRLGEKLREEVFRTQEERSLEEIRLRLQLLERMAALGRVTAGVAHEVKNPLNSMRLWLENLQESLRAEPGTHQQALGVLDKEIDRLDAVVRRLLEFYKPVELHLESTNLATLLGEALETVRPQLEKGHVTAETQFAADVPEALADRELLRQALLNLILNAVEAMPDGGRLTLGLERGAGCAVVQVADTGRGIPPELQPRIFQLFFTTRPGGNGIGLATVFKTVQMHGGSIDFHSEAGRGTEFRIEVPLAR